MKFLHSFILTVLMIQVVQVKSWDLPKFSMPTTSTFARVVEVSKPYITKKNSLILCSTAVCFAIAYKLIKKDRRSASEIRKDQQKQSFEDIKKRFNL
ncbi:MAG: hypothetical protein P4L22_05380 [Candidatus Babeliales bacterium]|nr:hypothetical protein [Candidatus Babeliales bacterium]